MGMRFASLWAAMMLSLSAGAVEEDTLRVLVWNVLRGGNSVEQGPEKALEVIRSADVDLVLMQESYDIDGDRPTLGRWIAGELGWNVYQGTSPHLCVLTPLEIEAELFHHNWNGVGARIRDREGREFVAFSIWLDYRSYISYDLIANPNITDSELLAAETERSSRLGQALALLDHLRSIGLMNSAVPVLVGGDFNTPSHLDWTEDAAFVFRNRRALDLPVSSAFADAGFLDAYRIVHPNPVVRPGWTWSPMYRSADQGYERIDRLYVLNPNGGTQLQPIHATTIPQVWEAASTPVESREFPSDHSAVLIELTWR